LAALFRSSRYRSYGTFKSRSDMDIRVYQYLINLARVSSMWPFVKLVPAICRLSNRREREL
jgi:hypothetical protein